MKQTLNPRYNAGIHREIDNLDKSSRFFFGQMPGSGTFK